MTTNKPTHEVFHVTESGKGEEKKSYWNRIGAMWAHKDGDGFNLSLDLIPLTQNGHLVVRKIKTKEAK